MIIAVQGCSHGSLSQIYASVAKYESIHHKTVDVLLLCGDFQALRNRHDFASLAVPQKYQQLGTFHEYYSGRRRAPLLTIVIGGNHEASNYMWELYHGGWLAENIYYLGAAGCVNVGGIRIAGASGIYKDHDYNKGHFETVPYNNSTLRSIYHIRSYDVAKLMLLPTQDDTIFLSHDWPTTIPRYGNTRALLQRKTFFRQEVETDTLGSPPLLQLLKKVQPEYWFSAHLHVKFAALYKHGEDENTAAGLGTRVDGVVPLFPPNIAGLPARPVHEQTGHGRSVVAPIPPSAPMTQAASNPDEIDIDSEDDDMDADPPAAVAAPVAPAPAVVHARNPDEINIDSDEEVEIGRSAPPQGGGANGDIYPATVEGGVLDESANAEEALKVDESADLVEQARKSDPAAAPGVIGTAEPAARAESATSSAAQPDAGASAAAGPSRGGSRQTRFLALDKCGPGKDFIQFLDVPAPSDSTRQPNTPLEFTFDTRWLAITRALHPYLSTDFRQTTMPLSDHLETLVQAEMERIEKEGVLVPALAPPDAVAAAGAADGHVPGLERLKGPVPVQRVQKFWPTAPPEGQPGGSPSAWYTNPQTVAFCGMLEIENKINPAPGR